MNNEERDRHLYKYPDRDVLRNKLGIMDGALLEGREHQFYTIRVEEGVPEGRFDLQHLCDIHHHLFQDVYEWAGQPRQVDFHKGQSSFHPYNRIEMGMADVHKRLAKQDFLRGLEQQQFAQEAAEYIGDVNRLHPFREGNGRTQFQYLKQLGDQAGHSVDLAKFEQASWIQASIEANRFETARMADCISASLLQRQDQDRSDRARAFLERSRVQGQLKGPDLNPDRDDDIDI